MIDPNKVFTEVTCNKVSHWQRKSLLNVFLTHIYWI